MLEPIKERWNSLPAVKQRNMVVVLSALLLGCFILSMIIIGGTRTHDVNRAPNEMKSQLQVLEPRLMDKSEYLEIQKLSRELQAISKGPNGEWEREKRISALLSEFNNLPLHKKIVDGMPLLISAYEGQSSADREFMTTCFWVLWLLCGLLTLTSPDRRAGTGEEYRIGNLLLDSLLVCSGMVGFLAVIVLLFRDMCMAVCSVSLFTVGEPPVKGTLRRLKMSVRACGTDICRSFGNFRERFMPGYVCGVKYKQSDKTDWANWLRLGYPWPGIVWEGFKLSDGVSLGDVTERILETAGRSSHPSMRFYLSTVLKAHMFLTNSHVSSSEREMPDITFNNSFLRDFSKVCFKRGLNLKSTSGRVILEILSLLDEHGDCPSIMDPPSASMNDRRSHAILRKVRLRSHSLNVANRLAGSCMYQGEPLSRLLIAALAHDLGKMPHIDKSNAESHAQASVRVLDSISGFKRLPYAGAIRKAILEHHDIRPATTLGKKLWDANHDARVFEVADEGVFAEVDWEIAHMDEFAEMPKIYDVCRAIYPYLMDSVELESLRDNLTACENSADLVKDLEMILGQPQFLFNDAFRVGSSVADIAGATMPLRTGFEKDNFKRCCCGRH